MVNTGAPNPQNELAKYRQLLDQAKENLSPETAETLESLMALVPGGTAEEVRGGIAGDAILAYLRSTDFMASKAVVLLSIMGADPAAIEGKESFDEWPIRERLALQRYRMVRGELSSVTFGSRIAAMEELSRLSEAVTMAELFDFVVARLRDRETLDRITESPAAFLAVVKELVQRGLASPRGEGDEKC